MQIKELFKALETTAGVNEKLALIEANKSKMLKQIFQYTFDGQKQYGVKNAEKRPVKQPMAIETLWDPDCMEILDKLASRKLTGNHARATINNLLEVLSDDDQDIFLRVLNKSAKIGISESSLKKIWPDLLDEFEVALANNFKDRKGKIDWNVVAYYISRKLDGVRVIARYSNGDVKFLSRQNKEFITLDKVKQDVLKLAKDNQLENQEFVLDGEMCLVNANGDEDFQGIIKLIRRKDYTIENPCYKVFDFLTADEFDGVAQSPIFSERLKIMKKLITNYQTIKLVEQEKVTDVVFEEWQQKAKAGSWEGTMLRRDAPYKSGRNDDLLKVKKMEEAEYKVDDVILEEINFTEPGKGLVKEMSLSAVKITHKGNTVQVGSGFSKEERRAFCNDPSKIIGKTITVQYFEETQAENGSYSLRFPVYRGIRDYE